MARGFVLRNNLTKEIILTIVKVGVFAIAATSPYFLHTLVKTYFKNKNEQVMRNIGRRLKDLEKKKIVNIQELPDNTIKVTLTQFGQKIAKQYDLEEMRIQKPDRWDGKWRVVIYDIPTSKKKASDAFREKIKNLGLYQLQKSIWIYPYDCMEEIEVLCGVFGINSEKHICHFKTPEIPKENQIKTFFF